MNQFGTDPAPDGLPLDAPALLRRACQDTALDDYGDDESFPQRLEAAVRLIRDARMAQAGEDAAAKVIYGLLCQRLRFFDDRKRYPIDGEQIVRPLFATGEPRSGTTLLHALLSVDPNGRALRFWELMYPSPPPGVAPPDDPRRAKADEDWREILDLIPRWLISHPYNDMLGDGLPECERTWAFDFRIMTPTAWWRVPMPIAAQGLPADYRRQYAIHKMMLQHLQFRRSAKYWVLKGFHGQRLAALFETYPDASIIWVHRDPVQIIASRIVLTGQIVESIVGHLDWAGFAQQNVAAVRANLDLTIHDPLVDDPRIHHVCYAEFVSDPVGTLKAYYEKYAVPFTSETEKAMRHYLANNRSDRYGKFEYSLDVIGEDIEALHREFAPYRTRFGVEIEKR